MSLKHERIAQIVALGIAARDAVFVGDSLEADVRGAKALGMTAVWKLNGRHEAPPESEADHTIMTSGSCSRSAAGRIGRAGEPNAPRRRQR